MLSCVGIQSSFFIFRVELRQDCGRVRAPHPRGRGADARRRLHRPPGAIRRVPKPGLPRAGAQEPLEGPCQQAHRQL